MTEHDINLITTALTVLMFHYIITAIIIAVLLNQASICKVKR